MQVQTSSLKSNVYSSIMNGIIRGEYRPNQILNEKELVERYGYSKSPIREALIELCKEGVLRNIPRYGYEVIRLTQNDVQNILDFRLYLESGCLKAGFSNLDAKGFQELKAINECCIRDISSKDMWSHWEYNCQFHLKLCSLANNPYAYDKLKESMDILKRAYAQFHYDKWDSYDQNLTDMKSHAVILDHLHKGELDQALYYLSLDLKDFGQ